MNADSSNKVKVVIAAAAAAVALGATVFALKYSGKPFNKKGGESSKKEVAIRPVSTLPQKGYTKEELSKFTGEDGGPILLSVKRKVYEVAPHFYGHGAHYSVFAGKECSRPFAKAQLSDTEANKYWADCTEEELEVLEEYVVKFDGKYPVVGWFIPDETFYQI